MIYDGMGLNNLALMWNDQFLCAKDRILDRYKEIVGSRFLGRETPSAKEFDYC